MKRHKRKALGRVVSLCGTVRTDTGQLYDEWEHVDCRACMHTGKRLDYPIHPTDGRRRKRVLSNGLTARASNCLLNFLRISGVDADWDAIRSAVSSMSTGDLRRFRKSRNCGAITAKEVFEWASIGEEETIPLRELLRRECCEMVGLVGVPGHEWYVLADALVRVRRRERIV